MDEVKMTTDEVNALLELAAKKARSAYRALVDEQTPAGRDALLKTVLSDPAASACLLLRPGVAALLSPKARATALEAARRDFTATAALLLHTPRVITHCEWADLLAAHADPAAVLSITRKPAAP